jgi:hypothetical protein
MTVFGITRLAVSQKFIDVSEVLIESIPDDGGSKHL